MGLSQFSTLFRLKFILLRFKQTDILKKILLFIALAFTISLSQAQITVNGQVIDAQTDTPLEGAYIIDNEGTKGAYTDQDGKYELSFDANEVTLRVEYLGYATQEIKVTSTSELNIKLQPTNTILDEVVITALGLERSSRKLGYAVQQLDGQELTEVQSANMVQSMAGKLAGVTVSQGATGIGSTSKIIIRGEGSFTNNNPLFLVDGTPINNNSILNFTNEAAAGFQEVDFGNGAMDISQDDIASISILKGPSAAALYGTRASNGVVLITTKTGKSTKGIGVTYNTSFSVERPFALPEFQNQYGQGNSGAFEFIDGLGAGTNDNITYSWGPRLDEGTLIAQFDSPVTLADGSVVRGGDVAVHGGAPITPTPFVSHPDNLKDFYQTGHTLSNHLSFSGAYDKGHYRFSVADLRNTSIIPGTNLNRNNVSARLQFNPTTKWSINTSLNYIYTRSDNRPASGYGSENVNYSLVAWGPRSLDINALEDYWQPGLEGVQQYSFNYTFFDNPLFHPFRKQKCI
jgi:TonB-dependent SusC/RagA subfamily outer membrane receptor